MPYRELLLESCEDRILCDASILPAATNGDPKSPPVIVAAMAAAELATAAPAPDSTASGTEQSPAATAAPATADVSAPAAGLTDAQRAAIESVVRDSTNQIWFEKNVGQYPEGVHYGFRTNFGAMLVYADHLRLISTQDDAATGASGVQTVDISFTGSNGNWEIVTGGQAGVSGNYQQADGSVLQPATFKELTLRNVYAGTDLRLYSAAQGTLEFDWIVAQAQDYAKIRLTFTGQDGISYGADGSATLDLRYQDITLKMPETYQVIDGIKHLIDAQMVAGDSAHEMRYALSGDIVADQPLVIDPNVAWSTYIDLNDGALPFDSYVFAVTVNTNGVYASGWMRETVTNGSFGNYMEVNAGFSVGTATFQNYIYRLNAAGTNITAWTSTGVVNDNSGVSNQKLNSATNDAVADLELFPDGRVLAGFNSGRLQIYSADLSTRSYNAEPVTMDTLNAVVIVSDSSFYASGRVAAAIPIGQIPVANIGPDATYAGGALGLEGVIVRYSNATTTPTPDWATYVGGSGDEYFTTIALTPDRTKLVFATSTVVAGSYPILVNAVDSTAVGTTELLVGVLTDQATTPAAFSVLSFLGGDGSEGTLATNTTAAVVTATNSYFYLAGNTNSAAASMPGITGGAQVTNGGGNFDVFIARIALNGSAGAGFQTTFLGGSSEDNIGGIAYDTAADRLLVFGTTAGNFPVLNTTPASNYYQGTFGGGTWDIFVATFTSDLTTKDYATYIGGGNNDYLGQTGDLIGQGHVFYSPDTGLTYLATTVHSGLPAGVIGTPPGKDTTKSNAGNDTHAIFAFNINIFDYGDAPVSYEGSPANSANSAVSSTLRLGAIVDAEATPNNGATATGDDTLNSDDEDGSAALNVLAVGDTTYSTGVSVLNNSGANRSLQGWIDFNRNGTFEVGEYTSVTVATGAALQNIALTWSTVPPVTVGQSYLRLRIDDGGLTDTAGTTGIDERSIGRGGFGEVEDYALAIVTSSVAGTVYSDQNNNGLIGGAEPRLAGITLTLTGTNDLGVAVSRSTTTDASGSYTFASLRPSNATGYTITETQPAGYLDGQNTVGTAGGATVNNPLSDVISGVVVSANVAATGYHFGELSPNSLAGTVYRDLNNDGVQLGAGETGVSGVTITLTGTDDLGAAVNTTATTDASGNYALANLRPGTYTIIETQPAGLLDGKEAVGSQASGTINNSADNNTISTITLGTGASGTGNNFGELPPSSLAGVVFNDVNHDGTQQAGDLAISGVSVTLTGTDDLGTAVSVSTTTNGSGAYTFGNLRPGTYTLTETQPAGLLDGKETAGSGAATAGTVNNTAVSNTISGIVLGTGQTGIANNFAELSPDSLAGTVYRDLNNDGVQLGGGETGVTGVTITLTGTDDYGVAVNVTTTTDASGNYALANVRPGTYTITESQPAGLLDGKETVGSQGSGTINNAADNNTISTITLGTGISGTGNNFGELPASLFAGTVYLDANNDGIRLGAGETGISGATVSLTGTDDRGVAVSLSTTTNASGAYSFGTLRPGTYTLTETQPVGYIDGKNTAGTSGGTTVNNPLSDVISAITLVANASATGYNFGELQSATLSGSAYLDANNDGVIQGGETAQSGVTITLSGTDDFGAAVSISTATNAAGAYTFTNLRPGTYTLTETQPAGLLDGKETAGAGATTPGAVNSAINSNTVAGIVIASGQTGSANNFGDVAPSSLAATVYRDLNNDGTQFGAGETGISGETITLTGTDDRGNAVNTAVTTDASGNVSFTSLRPGTYTLTETQPVAFNDGLDSNGTPAGTLTNDQVANIAVVSGTTGTGYKFGELPTTSISGTAYRDLNNDGLIGGAGETGISGVTVALTGTNDLGTAVNLTTTTGASGNYSFAGLRPSNGTGYTLTETQPAGLLDGKNTVGNSGGTTVNNPASDVILSVVVTAGTGATGYNFGELPPSTLSGAAYLDANNDGVFQGGETAQSGVAITLTGTDDLGNAVSVSTTTNASGAYAFTNLRPGTYNLAETQPTGTLDGRETLGTQASGTVDNTTNSDVIAGITLAANVTGTANNFADLRPSTLAGAVFSDGNNDGAINGADAGIAGATMTLTGTDDRGNAVSTAITTNASGAYSFGTLRPGTYTLTETQPAGFLDGKDAIGTPGGTAANDVFGSIVVTEGTSGANNNFAELVPASLAGSVYIDANNDGVRQGGETGVAGVTITLAGTDDLGGAVNVTTTTNASGAYSFAMLRPSTAGGYTITETQPTGYGDGTDAIGTPGGTAGNDVLSAIVLTAGVGGTGNNFGERIMADLAITKTDGSLTYIPGTAISYTVVVSNTGPSFATGATVADALPAAITGATWTATYVGVGSSGAASGSGDINTSINLAPGGSATLTITGTVLTTATGNLVNIATVTPPADVTDPTPGNNSATDTNTANITADLSITKTDGVTTVVPGTLNTYSIVVSNAGPSFVTGATITDTLPPTFVGATWTAFYAGTGSAGAAAGSGNINTPINLASGGTATFTVTGTVASTATGTLINTATVTPPVGVTDPTPGNNTATDTDTLTPTADLTLTKTDGSLTYVPGTAISYTVVVSNTGPSFATGATIADALPAAITGATWTATYVGVGSSGAASGSGDINTTINLASGGSATFTIIGTVLTTATGNLVNTATVTPPVGVTDPTPGNNSATDTDTANITADLSITKTDGSVTYIAGTAITYTVVVNNAGPSFVTGATLTDTIPANITGATWTAAYVGAGSSGAVSGSGNINMALNLATGGSATFTITGTVLLTATGNLTNTATITPPVGATDPTPGNNSATDTDTREVTGLAGFVFRDANNDGIQQAGEAGIAGATVTLTGTDNLSGVVNRIAATLADGSYSFANLRPSDAAGYTLTETQPAGFLDGKDTIGTPGGTAADDAFSSIVLAAGVNGTGYNFGELIASSVAGRVFDDRNNDGAFNGADSGLGGVTVQLTGTDDLGAAVTLAQTTDVNGDYSFLGLRPGSYTLTETQPAGLLDGKESAGTQGATVNNAAVSQTISAITLDVNVAGMGNNFGELVPASLGGAVYTDTDASGGLDGGDLGIDGVTVTLTGTDDLGNAVSTAATTAGGGLYDFTGLRPGSYTITESQPAAYLDGRDAVGSAGGTLGNDVVSAITLPANITGTAYNFGETRASSLAGYGYVDADNDGVFTGGETPIAGATIALSGTDFQSNAVSQTTATDASGRYMFALLSPGTYTLNETQPVGYLDGKDTLGTPGGTAGNDSFGTIVLGENVAGADNNFGELIAAQVSGSVYVDANNDGVFDSGETAINGVGVTLSGTDDLGNSISLSATTDATGGYSFTGLRPGTYTLTETQPGAYLDGRETAGSAGGTVDNLADSQTIAGFDLTSGANSAGNSFGEFAPASLGGKVFHDLNNDGVVDGGETGVAGVSIALTGMDDRSNAVSTTLTTDANGDYDFTNLRPGTYTLAEVQPAGLLDGRDTPGTQGGTAGNDSFTAINVTSGTAGTANNFGELPPSTISGGVFVDANNDGVRDAGEAALVGASLTLTGTDDLGNTVSLAMVTDGAGDYSFTNLRPGTYTLTEAQPAGLFDGRDTAGSAGGSTAVNDSISSIPLAANEASGGNNFGELRPSLISGTVFNDANNDGVPDSGETGQPDVTMTLTGTDDLGNPVSRRTTTDVNGDYSFANLRPGSYTLTETQPAGLLDGQDTLGTQGGTAANDSFAFILSENATGTGNNFGELAPGTVGGFVYLDANNDGLKDPAEPGIAGVTVRLTGTDDLGTAVDVRVTSDGDGAFTFNNVRPGTYTLTETQPGGVLDGRETAGSANGDASVDDVISAIPITPGTNAADYLFGERSIPPVIPRPVVPAPQVPKPAPQPTPFLFAYDSFHNFAVTGRPSPVLPGLGPIDIWRPALLPLAPIYSGEADPSATLVIDIYNANGVRIGSQTVMADAGGNWLANFGGAVLRDTPSDVRITQISASYSFGGGAGRNLRTYYAPAALNPGHFLAQFRDGGLDDEPAPLLGGLDLANPIQLDAVKYGASLLPAEGVASGN